MANYLLYSNVSGKGKQTIVLLHGYLASSQYFKHIRKRLEQRYHVVALDLLGFGRSPKPRIDYTYDDHIAAVRYTLDQLGVKRPYILLGHSMGALIALRYATLYGNAISKLLLFNPPLFANPSELIQTHRESGRRYRVLLYTRRRHLYWAVLNLLPKNRSAKRKAINLTDITSPSSRARERSYRHIIIDSRPFQDMRKLTVPTLLAVGDHDRYIYLENLRQRNLPTNITLRIIDTGHHPLVRDVDLSDNLIRSFLQRDI